MAPSKLAVLLFTCLTSMLFTAQASHGGWNPQGANDNPSTPAAWVMVGTVGAVLTGIVAFILYLRRQSKRAQALRQARFEEAEPTPSDEENGWEKPADWWKRR